MHRTGQWETDEYGDRNVELANLSGILNRWQAKPVADSCCNGLGQNGPHGDPGLYTSDECLVPTDHLSMFPKDEGRLSFPTGRNSYHESGSGRSLPPIENRVVRQLNTRRPPLTRTRSADRRRSSYGSNYDVASFHRYEQFEKARFSSLQRPSHRRHRKPPDSILKNTGPGSYSSLPRGYSYRNSVKFASPVDSEPKSFDSDQLDFIALNKNVYENHLSDRQVVLRDGIGCIPGEQFRGSNNQVLVDNTVVYAESCNLPLLGKPQLLPQQSQSQLSQLPQQPTNEVPPPRVDAYENKGTLRNAICGNGGTKSLLTGNGVTNQGYSSLTSKTTFPIAQSGNKVSDDKTEDKWKSGPSSSNGSVQGNGAPPGAPRSNYTADSEHFMRKSASVQIIAHEPSRCEGCFDGRLPMLMVVISIGVVIFLLCIGVIVDFKITGHPDETPAREITSPPDSSIPCEDAVCSFGAVCVAENEEDPKLCKCMQKCTSSVRPVCGSDGLTYDNDCLRQQAQCRLQKPVKLVQTGPCVKDPCLNVECPENQMCLPSFDLASARCVCKGPCPDSDETVCGSDGVDYTSMCHLQRDSCQAERNVSKVYDGSCDPCKHMRCPTDKQCIVDQERIPSCSCIANCTDTIQVVCASNGKSYRNQCTMKQDSCRLGADLQVIHSGECHRLDPCARLQCIEGAECVTTDDGDPRCVCNECPPVQDPVCGHDNVTYPSLCHMKQRSCQLSKLIELKHFGECRQYCKSRNCPPYSECRVDYLGESSCVCLGCSFEWEPVCGNSAVYDNVCQLKSTACSTNTNIRPKPLKDCDMSNSLVNYTIVIPPPPRPPLPPRSTPAPLTTRWNPPTPPPPITTPARGSGGGGYVNGGGRGNGVYHVGDCSSNPCQGGGSCEAHDGTFTCFCPNDRAGQLCDIKLEENGLDVPSFTGKSFIKYRILKHLEHRTTIELEIKPYSDTGTILYSQQTEDGLGDYLAISLLDGYVELKFNLGDGFVLIKSMNPVALGKWNTIIIKRWHQDGMMKVNHDLELKGRTNGFLKSLDLSSPLYLGSVPDPSNQVFMNTGTTYGFDGCIRKFKINSKTFLFSNKDSLFLSKHEVRDCTKMACRENFCLNKGECQEVNGNPVCRCQAGYEGNRCEELNTWSPEPSFCQINPGAPHCVVCTEDCRVPDFSGNSYLTLRLKGGMATEFKIEVWIYARSLDGCVLYSGATHTGGGDFFALNLDKGFIDFRYDLGSGYVSIKTHRPVTLHTWHKVRIGRQESYGSLQVNDDPLIEGRSPPPMTELNLRDTIYVGGFSDPSILSPNSGVMLPLNGAIQRIIINGEVLANLWSVSLEKHGVRVYMGAPCHRHTCDNGGLCVHHFRTAVCRCTPGYSGTKCSTIVT